MEQGVCMTENKINLICFIFENSKDKFKFIINCKLNIYKKYRVRAAMAIDSEVIYIIFFTIVFTSAVCYGVRGRALASQTDVRGFEPQCGGRLSSLTC